MTVVLPADKIYDFRRAAGYRVNAFDFLQHLCEGVYQLAAAFIIRVPDIYFQQHCFAVIKVMILHICLFLSVSYRYEFC